MLIFASPMSDATTSGRDRADSARRSAGDASRMAPKASNACLAIFPFFSVPGVSFNLNLKFCICGIKQNANVLGLKAV